MYIYTRIHMYISLHILIFTKIYLHVRIHVFICTHRFMNILTYFDFYTEIYVFIHTCIYKHIYINVYPYVFWHLHKWNNILRSLLINMYIKVHPYIFRSPHKLLKNQDRFPLHELGHSSRNPKFFDFNRDDLQIFRVCCKKTPKLGSAHHFTPLRFTYLSYIHVFFDIHINETPLSTIFMRFHSCVL